MRRAALLVLVLLAAACSRSEGDEYPQKVRDEFMQGCLETAKSRLEGAPSGKPEELAQAYCGCVFENVRREIPFKQFNSLFMQGGKLDSPDPEVVQKMTAVISVCQEKTRKDLDSFKGTSN